MILSEIKKLKCGRDDKSQRINIVCDNCGKEYIIKLRSQQNGFLKNNKDICKSCIDRKNIVKYNKLQKGKTLEERIGIEKAKKAKSKMSKSRSGKGNPNFGGIWHGVNQGLLNKGKKLEEIHGIEKAARMRENLSIKFSGKNNPMYGNPSPQGSGNGWSGWYKGWFFRSFKELSYMIFVIERFNLKWENAEQNKYKIKYIDWKGNSRTYHSDFLIEEKYLVEIKPKNFWNSDGVKRKKEAAEIWCKENNFKYKLTECTKQITFKEIQDLIKENKLIFTKRYQQKFKQWEN